MKIAIASAEKDINSKIDERFGRCNFFYIYDTDTKKGVFFENPYKEGNQGVGTKIVEFLASHTVKEIFAVEVGEKAKNMLDKLNMKSKILDKNSILADIIREV